MEAATDAFGRVLYLVHHQTPFMYVASSFSPDTMPGVTWGRISYVDSVDVGHSLKQVVQVDRENHLRGCTKIIEPKLQSTAISVGWNVQTLGQNMQDTFSYFRNCCTLKTQLNPRHLSSVLIERSLKEGVGWGWRAGGSSWSPPPSWPADVIPQADYH